MRSSFALLIAAVLCAYAASAAAPAQALFLGSLMDRGKKAAEDLARKKAEEAKKKAEEELAKKKAEAIKAAESAAKEFALGLWTLAKKKLADAMPWIERVRKKLEQWKDEGLQKLSETYETLKEKAEQIKEKGKEYGEKVMKEVEELREKIEGKYKEIVEKARTIAGKVMEKVHDLFAQAKAFGEKYVERAKALAGAVQEKVQYVVSKAREKAQAAVELGQELMGKVTSKLKEGWDFASKRAQELAGQVKGFVEKVAAKAEQLKGEKLRDLQSLFMAARLKLEALTEAAKGAVPNPELAGELYAAIKKFVGGELTEKLTAAGAL